MNRTIGHFFALLFACAPAALAAQGNDVRGLTADPTQLGPGMDPSQGRIALDVTVTGAQGNAVAGLKQTDFKLLDEDQPQTMVTFAASSPGGPAPGDPPVSIIMVLDEADISPANLLEAQSDIEKFLRANGGRLTHPVTFYRVASGHLYATLNPFLDGNALAETIDSGKPMRSVWMKENLVVARGPTNEIEISAVPSGSDSLLPQSHLVQVREPIALKALGAIAIEQRREPGRKLLFWIGPGWRVDLKSDGSLFDNITEFSTRLREARIEISVASRWLRPGDDAHSMLSENEVRRYGEGVRLRQDAQFANVALQVLAERTGGRLLTNYNDLVAAANPELSDIPRFIAEHIAQSSDYYRLTFDPPRTSEVDEYHRLNVELALPGLTAHTTAGYYDEPVFYDQPLPATEQVTVAQLEERLASKQSDRELARVLSGLELTERVSTARLDTWMKRMPGSPSRRALVALVDASVFLPPPVDDSLSMPAPDPNSQTAILSRVADFIARQLPRLPNFYADRPTIQYGEPMPKSGQTWKTAQPDRNLLFERTTTDHVFFEDGKETAHQQKQKVNERLNQDYLQTTGTFGPILMLTLRAATAPGSTLQWSRWEKGESGPVAVFQYAAAHKPFIYQVGFCCLALDQDMIDFRRNASFHGEFSVDPATGHILRLTVEADLEPRLPLRNSSILVEYGPVQMGGKTYFCPLRSVSTSRQRRLWQVDEWGMTFKVYGPFKSIINNVTFDRYHLFSSESTILPGFVPVPQTQ